jgi:phosphate transport system substrate-binding protein
MKKSMLVFLSLLMITSLLAGCSQPEPAPEAPAAPAETPADDASSDVDWSEMIEVKGSDTMVNLGQAWAEAFMDKSS